MNAMPVWAWIEFQRVRNDAGRYKGPPRRRVGRPKSDSDPLAPAREAVKLARRTVGLSQAKAARFVDVGTRTWQRWEAGETVMPYTLWCDFLRLTKQHAPLGFREAPRWQEVLQSRAHALKTQGQAAELLGVTVAQWSAWENGSTTMPSQLWSLWLEAIHHDG